MTDKGYWKDRPVLVTGAGGFMGSHLAEQLVSAGARVRAMVHYNALGRRGWMDGSEQVGSIEVLAGDITDGEFVRRAMNGIDTVFHLAALIAIPYSYVAPASYVRTNVEGTLNVLQAGRDLKTSGIIHTSTSEVYGSAVQVPITEDHLLQGQSPYSASKIGADKLAESFYCSFDVPVVTVRPFNTFGPRQSARAIIPTIIAQCLAGRKVIRLGNLEPTRDLNYVGNIVDGFMAAGSTDAAVGKVIHLGSGNEISIGDLTEKIAGVAGVELEIESDADRVRPGRSEVDRLCADASLARELLGWQPEVSLDDGLKKTVDWMRNHQDLYRPDDYVI
jgi:NAD dependent epimerase/dehydratase